jgi:glycine C-acetyltransferase
MYGKIKQELIETLDSIKSNGLYKNERIITSKQGAEISTTSSNDVLNF